MGITSAENRDNKFSAGFHFANFQTRLTAFWNSRTFSAEFRREAGALDVTRDEVVADDVNGANPVAVARVDTAVRAVRGNQRRHAELFRT
jgi:hypothetical protein